MTDPVLATVKQPSKTHLPNNADISFSTPRVFTVKEHRNDIEQSVKGKINMDIVVVEMTVMM